jgi:hypothetical protein
MLHILLISGFRRDVDDICGVLGYYTALCGNYLPIITTRRRVITQKTTGFNVAHIEHIFHPILKKNSSQ